MHPSPPHEYNHLQVWAHAKGIYVSSVAKKSSSRSLIFSLIHRLIASTICHREECNKAPSGDLSYTWCLIRPEVCLNLPYSLVLYLSSLAVGPMAKIRIYGGHWVTRLDRSYGVNISGMVLCSTTELGVSALKKIWEVVQGSDQVLWIPDDDIFPPLR